MGADSKLTRRGKDVADLVALGLTNREIARRLVLSERTVEWHIEQIFNKLGFGSRSQIAAWVGRLYQGQRYQCRVSGSEATSQLSSRAS